MILIKKIAFLLGLVLFLHALAFHPQAAFLRSFKPTFPESGMVRAGVQQQGITGTSTATVVATPTPIPPTEEQRAARPTRTPRPTATPPTIPPPSDIEKNNLMIGFGLLIVIVICIGVWINRDRIL